VLYKNEPLGVLTPVLLTVSLLPLRSLPSWSMWIRCMQELWAWSYIYTFIYTHTKNIYVCYIHICWTRWPLGVPSNPKLSMILYKSMCIVIYFNYVFYLHLEVIRSQSTNILQYLSCLALCKTVNVERRLGMWWFLLAETLYKREKL